jgi:hypothetical protein
MPGERRFDLTPEQRERLLAWLPPGVVDAYPPGYDGPLDERTPGVITRSGFTRRLIERDRDRLIDDARD